MYVPFASAWVLAREASRSSRRFRTYLLRAGYALVLGGMIVLTWRNLAQLDTDAATWATIGRDQFVAVVVLQMFLVAMMTPLLVGQAMVEERLDRTLELLTISRLTPTQILAGKLVSRLLILGTITLAGVPLLAMQLQLGGVSTFEVGVSALATATVLLLLAMVSANVALYSRGVVAPLVVGFLFSMAAFLVVPGLGAIAANGLVSINGDAEMARFSPWFWSFADTNEGLWPPFLWLPTFIAGMRASVVSFRLRTVDGEHADPARHDRDVWEHDAWVAWTSVWAVVALAGAPALVAMVTVRKEWMEAGTTGFPDDFAHFLAVAWVAIALHAGTLLLLQLSTRLLANLDGWWAHLRIAPPGGEDVPIDAAPAPEPSSMVRIARVILLPWTRIFRGRVWGEAITWRELFTGASAGGTLGVVVFSGFWLGLVVMIGCSGGLESSKARVALGTFGLFVDGLLVCLLAAMAFADERRSRTLELLLVTPIWPSRIATAKLFAVLIRVVPLAVVSAALLASGFSASDYDSATLHSHSPFGLNLAIGLSVVRVFAMVGWAAAAAFALASWGLVVSLRVRPASAVWPASLALPFALPFAAAMIAASNHRSYDEPANAWDAAQVLLLPFTGDAFTCRFGGTPPEVLLSTAAYLVVGVPAAAALALRLRRWAADEGLGGG
jgi:ABC-type transport system involved in multi-copper enzyme maturation permease subunit